MSLSHIQKYFKVIHVPLKKKKSAMLTLIKPGGNTPPLDVSRDNFEEFFFRAPCFRDYFLLNLAQLLTLFSYKSGIPSRSYATLCNRASAQNMGIFWICVQNIWKMAFCAKKCVICLDFC